MLANVSKLDGIMKKENQKNKKSSDLELKIINYLNQKFQSTGFRNFSVEDVSSKLHISKKTIYKIFGSKEGLIRSVLIGQLSVALSEVVKIIQEKSNIIEKFVDLSNMVKQYFSVFNDASLKRLSYNFPQLAEYIEQFRIHRVIPLINMLFQIGKKKNMILDIPQEIILKIFTSTLATITESKPEKDSSYSYHQIFRHAFYILLNGILTKKGKQLLNYKFEVIQ